MEQQIKVKLILRGQADKKNICEELDLPTDEKNIKKALENISGENSNSYEIVKTSYAYPWIYYEDISDIYALNKQLSELQQLSVSIDEIIAVKEYFACKSIQDVVNALKNESYEFYNEYDFLYKFDDSDIADKIDAMDILDRLEPWEIEELIYKYYSPEQIIELFEMDEQIDYLLDEEDGFYRVSTGVIKDTSINVD